MKKKLISLLLCVAMLLSFTMASCSTQVVDEEELAQKQQARGVMTLVWALICDAVPSEETQETIEKAVNKITESRYMTHIDLQFYTEDNYEEVVEEKLVKNYERELLREAAVKAWKKFVKAKRVVKNEDGSTYKVETEKLYEMFWESFPEYEEFVQPPETTDEFYTETEAETVLNENNIGVLAYPEAEEHQLDILYISGYNNYLRYINNEWIAPLDESLASDSRLLSDYIFPAFLTAAETMYGTFAIPNNRTIGDYTYLLLHKELIEKYYYVADNITGITTELCQDFLYDVANFEPENFVPLLDNEATKTAQNIRFWNIDYETDEYGDIVSQSYKNTFSVLGSTYSKHVTQAKDGNSAYQCMILLQDASYTSQLKTLKQYEVNGYYGEGENETRPFAAGIVVGDMTDLVPKYSEDYHMIVVDYPRGNESDLFDSMWAVSNYCQDVKRAMEIITYLNTNVDFRNLIQYGIEGVHYTLDPETKVAEPLNDDYQMDLYKTGNVFLAYPEKGMNPDAWTYGKLQNQNAKVDLAIGFSIADVEETILNQTAMDSVILWTERVEKDLPLCNTPEEIEAYLSGFTLEPGTPLESLTKPQQALLEYAEIDPTKITTAIPVKGVVALMRQDEYLMIMTQSSYKPNGAYRTDPTTGQVLETNAEKYGYGESFFYLYCEWAIEMKFLADEDE